jgi:two-component system LytT family response regulator
MALLDKRSAPINVLVVDDEIIGATKSDHTAAPRSRHRFRRRMRVGVEAIEEIRKSKPDLVFLDVQMPECGGFDVLELLGSDLPPTIIFVTAYDEYALRAFEAGRTRLFVEAVR